MKQIFNKLKGVNETVIIFVIIAISAFGFLIFRGDAKEYGFVCPSDFTDGEEYINSAAKWLSEYQKDHPDADADEMISVRGQLIEKYGCGSSPLEVDENVENQIDAAEKLSGDQESKFSERDIYELVVSGKFDEALVVSEQYLKTYPSDPYVWTHRGVAFFLLGKCPEAIDALSHTELPPEALAENNLDKDPDYLFMSNTLSSIRNKCNE